MSPKPVRATTRKVASATPHAQLLAGILDAAHLYACSAPQLAGMLGRHVLELADSQPAALPRGAAHGLCAHCGVPFAPEVLRSGEPIKLPHHVVKRKAKSAAKAAAKGMAALPPVHRAAVLYDCQLCGHRTARPFSTLQAAADALRRAGGQVSEVLLTRAAAAAASGGKQQQQHPQQCSGIKGVDKAANKTGLLGTAVTEPAEEQGPVTLVEKQAEQQQAEQQAEQQQAEQQQAEQQQAEQQQAEQQQQQMEKQQQAAKTQPQLRGQQQRREVEQQQQQQQQEEQKEQVMVEEEMGADGAAMEAVSRTADEPAAEPGEEAAEVEEAADPAKAERQEHEEASMPPATPGTQPSVQQQQRRQECKEEPQPFLFGFNVQQTVTAPSAMEEASDKAAAVAQVPAQLDDDGDVEVPRRSRKRVHHSLSPTGAAVVAGDAALHAAALPTGHRAAKRARRISWADAKDAELERVRVFEQEPSDEVEKAAALVSTVAAAVAAGKRLRFKLWQRVGRRWCVFKPSG